jgi:hypothetical protein
LKSSGVDTFILDKADIKLKLIRRDKEGHCILIKRTIHQEDTMILNVCACNIGAPKFITQTLLTFLNVSGQIGSDIIIVDNLNAPISSTDGTSRQKKI